jgi:outer membrane protein TolC
MKLRVLAGLAIVAAGLAVHAQSTETIDLSLKGAIAEALARNLDIAVAQLDPKSAAEEVTSADAVFDSSLRADARFSRAEEEPSSFFSAEKQDVTSASVGYSDPLRWGANWSAELGYSEVSSQYPAGSENFGLIPDTYGASLGFNFTQPLLRNFGLGINRTGIEQAKNRLKISEAQLIQRVIGIIEQAESAYWDVVGTRNALGVAKSSRSLAEDFLKQTKIRVEVGTLPPIEITNAEAQVASREEGVIVGENNLRDAEDRLRALMRIDPDSAAWGKPINPTDSPDFRAVTVDAGAAIETAMQNRQELAQAELQLENLKLSERYQANQVKPELNLSANYTMSGNSYEFVPDQRTVVVADPDGTPNSGDEITAIEEFLRRDDFGRSEPFKELPDQDNTNWSISALFTHRLGNRAAKADLARTRVQLDQQKLNIEKTRQEIRVEVRQAARGLESSSQRVASARANVVLQRKRLEAEQKRFENGLSTSFQVLEAQNDLQDAENAMTSAEVAFAKSVTRLAAAQGTLLSERGITIEP